MALSDRRPLGGTGLEVSPICLGGNVFGWGADEEASFAVLDAWVAAGGDFVDTANMYSGWIPGNEGGESERIIGRWMADRGTRDRVVLATKVGMAAGVMPKGLTRDHVRRGIEGSLARLGTDRVELYYAHEDDADTPLEETLAAFQELVDEGLVGAVAVSNYPAERLREAVALGDRDGLARFAVLQAHYNLVDRAYEDDLGGVVESTGLAVLPYFALARGFLAGKYRPGAPLPDSVRAPGVERDYLNPRGFAILEAVEAVAAARGATAAQVSLAWLMAQPHVVAPVVSATTPAQLDELAGAASLTLDAAEVAALSAAGA